MVVNGRKRSFYSCSQCLALGCNDRFLSQAKLSKHIKKCSSNPKLKKQGKVKIKKQGKVKKCNAKGNKKRGGNKSGSNLPKAGRNAVWKNYFGAAGQGFCYCCHRETISLGNFDCGHIKSKKKGGKNDISNLRPICGLCNKSMGIKDMHSFMKETGFEIREKAENFEEIKVQSMKRSLFQMTPNKNPFDPFYGWTSKWKISTKSLINKNQELFNKLNNEQLILESKTPNFDREEKWFKKIYLKELIHNLKGKIVSH